MRTVSRMRSDFGVGFEDGEVLLVPAAFRSVSLRHGGASLRDDGLKEDHLRLLNHLHGWTEGPGFQRRSVFSRLQINNWNSNERRTIIRVFTNES